MEFLPIELNDELNSEFKNIPECQVIMEVFQELYKKVGFYKPWIAYFAISDHGEIIGGGGFKGPPKNGKVEISYGTFDGFEGKGVGTDICKKLVSIAVNTESSIFVSARTLPDIAASIKILERNGFNCVGTVYDEEDGEVLEWLYLDPSDDQRNLDK